MNDVARKEHVNATARRSSGMCAGRTLINTIGSAILGSNNDVHYWNNKYYDLEVRRI